MDCVQPCPSHHRRLSQLAHHPSTSVAGTGDVITGVVGSRGPTSGLCVSASVSSAFSKDCTDLPLQAHKELQQLSFTNTTTSSSSSNPISTVALAQDSQTQDRFLYANAATTIPGDPQKNEHAQHLPVINGHIRATTAVTDTSLHSSPLIETLSPHQQQLPQRSRPQRAVDETSHAYPHSCSSLGPSQDSRLGSQTRTNDDTLSAACVDSTTAAAVCFGQDASHQQPHQRRRHSDDPLQQQQQRVKCSASFSKRPRQQPQDRTLAQPDPPPRPHHANLKDDEESTLLCSSSGAAMYIPDLSTFADTSSQRHRLATATTKMTVSSESNRIDTNHEEFGNCRTPIHLRDQRSGSGDDRGTTNEQAVGSTEHEEDREMQRAAHSPLHLRFRGTRNHRHDSPPLVTTGVIVATGGGAAVTDMIPSCLSAPDATPQEPPPKRFATGEGEAVMFDELRDASGSRMSATADAPSQVPDANARGNEEGLYSPQQDGEERAQSLSASPRFDSDESGAGELRQPPGDRNRAELGEEHALSGVNWTARKQQQQSRARGRKKCASVRSSRNGGSDSVTAEIPYNPCHLPPRPSQSPKLGSAPDASTVVTSVSAHLPGALEMNCAGVPPTCATPPATQQQNVVGGATVAPPRALIQLTDTRYAFMALSFMMRMLCKLHKGEPIPSSDFHSHCIPPMRVTMYVQRLVRYCACSGEALLCSFLLLLKYVFRSGHPVTIYNAHRLLITGIVLGIKLRDDVYYSNVYYGRIGGISKREMNKLELLFLDKIEWETQVHEDEYVALLDLLAELRIDTEPTSAQLEAFSAAHPDKVAVYELDEEDEDIPESNAKPPSNGADSTVSAYGNDDTAAAAASTSTSLPAAEQQRLKVLRGAYRLHQWHTLVAPWIAHLEDNVLARVKENAAAAAAAQEEEGLRWQRYDREDELARVSRRKQSSSASLRISPISGQRRENSKGTITAPIGGVWSSEPPYKCVVSNHDGSNLPHRSSSDPVITAGGGGGGHSSAAGNNGSGDGVRYNNLRIFANSASSGCFGTNSAAVMSQGGRGPNPSQRNSYGASAAAERSMLLSSTSIPGHQQYTNAGAGQSFHYSETDVTRALPQSRHQTITMSSASAAADRPPRAATVTSHFDITNRVMGSSAVSPGNLNSVSEPRQPAARQQRQRQQQQQQQQVPSATENSARLKSPVSTTAHGSGINVNAQPYYYVSSRMRKQQQQQQATATATASSLFSAAQSAVGPASSAIAGSRANVPKATAVSTDGATDAAQLPPSATLEGSSAVHSPVSSFTSPACINSTTHLSSCPKPPTAYVSGHASQQSGLDNGVETVSMGSIRADSASSNARTHTFPSRPIPKSGVSNPGEQVMWTHVPQWLGDTTHAPTHAPVHRRSNFASQHSVGKKRSKPDSYKDY